MFDLDRAIRDWKKGLAKDPALHETYLDELEAALRDEVEALVAAGEDEERAFARASSGMGAAPAIGAEYGKVAFAPRPGRPGGRRSGFAPPLLWSYGRIALRRMRRQKGYAAINVAGLAVGLACCVLMALWIRDETNFDRFHENGASIYRVIAETRTANDVLLEARVATPLGPTLREAFPEVADFTRYRGGFAYGFKVDGRDTYDDVVAAAEPGFFAMFTFPFTVGDPATALDEPRSIVLTERLARKLFGDADPMGKPVSFVMIPEVFTVTGVARDVPANSHLRFDAVIPCINMQRFHDVDYSDWNEKYLGLYVRLAPGASPAAAADKMSSLFAEWRNVPGSSLRLQPLKDVHLKSDFRMDGDNASPGSLATLSVFGLAAAAILLLACINFANLATARSAGRGREVGLRKMTGARRSDLIRQFLGESVMLSFVGLGAALGLVQAVLPRFNLLSGKSLTLARVLDPWLLPGLLAAGLLTGLSAGAWPALVLSAFRPSAALKGGWAPGGRRQGGLRKALVVVQFALTVFLVIATVAVDRQLRYVRSKDLGIDTRNVLAVEAMTRDVDTLRSALRADPGILGVTNSLPPGVEPRGLDNVGWEGKDPAERVMFSPITVDEDYPATFGLRMAEGRFFAAGSASDRNDAVVINETAARLIGPDSAVGTRLTIGARTSPYPMPERRLVVIGVVKDFHQLSLRRPIEPTIFLMENWHVSLCVRVSPENVPRTLAFLERTGKSLSLDGRVAYRFLDEDIESFYASERRIKAVLGLFAALALFTSCLGLVGLAAFVAERRTREIGIRKVLGATTFGMVLLQTREFARWVVLANVLAWPAAFYAVDCWLRGYAYHDRPGIAPALAGAAFSLALAILSVGSRAVRAARANPVDAIRHE